MIRLIQIAFVAGVSFLVCAAFPYRSPGDPVRAGSYQLVLGKGPVPSFMNVKIKSGKSSDWPVEGTFSEQRISLAIKGKIARATGIMEGKATPSNGYSGKGCKVNGGWGNDRLVLKLEAPYNRRFELKYQGP